jgi:hypothetical protein
MRFPDEIYDRRFTDWNYLVRGLVEVWEVAHLVGLERELEQLLAQDRGGALTDLVARVGNDSLTVSSLLHARLRARTVADSEALLARLLGESPDAGGRRFPAAPSCWSEPSAV